MGRGLARTVVAVVALGCLLVPAVAVAGGPTIERHPVYGGAEAFFGDCPNTGIPPAGTVCIDNFVLFWKGVTVLEGGSVAPTTAPWQIYAETTRAVFDGSGGEPDVTLLRWGYTLLPDDAASADEVHLDTASVSAHLPMSDGSSFDFTGTWRAWSDRSVFGINGPATGLDHHYVDRCLTFVANGHQKFRFAHMTGTLNGVAVESYADFDFGASIFNNSFQYIEVPHGGCS